MHLVKRSSRHLPARGEDWTNLAGLTKDAISTLLILTDASRREGSRGIEACLLNFQLPCVLHLQPPRGRLTSPRPGLRRRSFPNKRHKTQQIVWATDHTPSW